MRSLRMGSGKRNAGSAKAARRGAHEGARHTRRRFEHQRCERRAALNLGARDRNRTGGFPLRRRMLVPSSTRGRGGLRVVSFAFSAKPLALLISNLDFCLRKPFACFLSASFRRVASARSAPPQPASSISFWQGPYFVFSISLSNLEPVSGIEPDPPVYETGARPIELRGQVLAVRAKAPVASAGDARRREQQK